MPSRLAMMLPIASVPVPRAWKVKGWPSRSFQVLYSIEATGTNTRRDIWNTTRSEAHTSELQSLMRISYAVFCLKQQDNDLPGTPHTSTFTSHVMPPLCSL